MLLKPEERETIISYNQLDDYVKIYTCDRKFWKHIDKLIKKNPKEARLIYHEKNLRKYDISKSYIVPKAWIKVRPPMKKTKKQMDLFYENFMKKKSKS